MKGSAIRQLAGSHDWPLIAAGHFEHKVEIWNVTTFQKVTEFDTPLDFGGHRLAISSDGKILLAGSYYAPGLAAFSIPENSSLWRRTDLRQLQNLDLSSYDVTVAAGFEKGPLHVLQIENGETIEQMRGAERRHSSPFTNVHLYEKRTLELHSPKHAKPVKIKREEFGVLSVCFSPDAVVISEATGPVRCFALDDGSLRWHYQPSAGWHVLELGYNSFKRVFLGIERHYDSRDTIYPLRFFDERTGEVVHSAPTEQASEYCFGLQGTRLISTDGWVLDTGDAKLIGSLEFPFKDYRD